LRSIEYKERTMLDPKYQHRIVRDPKRCGGEPTIRGTRVTLRVILASLAEGDRPAEIIKAFPSICLEDVRAAIAFAAESLDEAPSQQVVLLNAS
jgi:uncharacterized protein (DUF433 family)